ncbi:MAG: VOC family protein [Mesorhizobium amorphae]|nr:MAG: VOC family protein [Mesorhizobium amorphae]
MRDSHGTFIWYELNTPDPEAATAFYRSVLGWDPAPFPGNDNGYQILHAAHGAAGGLMPIGPETECAVPGWFGYVGMDDVEAAVRDALAAGGTEHIPPTDIPGVGRFALLADPQGATFYVMRGESDEKGEAFSVDAVGHCNWNELATDDPEAALRFYGGLFGWRKEGGMPMGAMGEYEFLSHDGTTFGAQMRRTADGPGPLWTFYFGVGDIDGAHRALLDGGGAVHFGPDEIPGGMFAIVASDPQGALFGLVGPRV